MKKITLIASRDDRLRQALSFLFGSEPDIQIAGSINDPVSLLALADISTPDLVLLDRDLVGQPGIDVAMQLRIINPAVKIIAFSVPIVELGTWSAEADVCITKDNPPDAILENFRALYSVSQFV